MNKFPLQADGNIDIDAWLEKIKHHTHLDNIDVIQKAAHLARKASRGLTTFYGQSCLEQGLEMAEMILDLKLDPDSIAAALLTSTAQHSSLPAENISKEVGQQVASLVERVISLNVINQLQSQQNITRNPVQIDRLRKMILAMASDIRVVLIKLAERICIMRGVQNINPIERKRLAEVTMDIYAPLANRLGLGQFKWELEDLSFHYIDPETYDTIANFLADNRSEREKKIQMIISQLKENLSNAHIKADITGRAKHIYSIYLKMKRKNSTVQHIYDITAIRLLVPTIDDCYTALSIVHRLWNNVPEEFDDYISKPKPNGYRSIHTAVIDADGKHFEIQIRTNAMHEESEHGFAAHWIYKEKKSQLASYETKITLLRQLLEWHKDLAKQNQNLDEAYHHILSDRVYVFTPAGDIIELPFGSTPLDFAYHIHSSVGHQCRGAKIHGAIVPLTHHLQTGDQIEILTSPHGTPSRDWLNKEAGYLKTTRARTKVAQWFKQQDIETGKQHPVQHKHETETRAIKPTPHKKTVTKAHHAEIGGIQDLLTRVAKCCKPVPGDPIMGFITQGRGVSIHKMNCKNLNRLTTDHEERLLQVNWDNKLPKGYHVDLLLQALNQENILKDITSLLATTEVRLISLNSTIDKKLSKMTVKMTVEIQDLTHLKQILHQIEQLPNIISIKRL